MGEKKKASLLLRTKKVLRKRNINKLLLIGAIILLMLVVICLLYAKYDSIIRDNSRKDLMRQINLVALQVYDETGKHPSAILFSQDEALVCEDIDCIENHTVQIGKFAKSISGSNTKTSPSYTKYGYELDKDGYKLGYCDEDGTVQNYGISRESIILMCN